MSKFLNDVSAIILQPKNPEWLVFFGLMACFNLIQLADPYPLVFAVVTAVGLLAWLITVFKKSRTLSTAVTCGLFSLVLGILQFDFIPSLAIWLLIFARLTLLDKRHNQWVLVTTVITVMFALSLSKFFLPPLVLNSTQQKLINLTSLLLTSSFVAFMMLQLITRINALKAENEQNHSRIKTFVSVTNKLTRFLPPQVWQPLLKENASVDVISNRRKLTIMFSDIVGFTDLSDSISADHLANILNTYFDRMTQITIKYGATLDKFIGDGLLCYFGDEPNSNDRDCAIRCASMAIEMRREMETLRQQWRLLGFEGLYVRIGINTGYCYVGNFGSRNRMTYTVIGKEANFASRLESAAEKNQILISESTYNLISHEHNCQLLGEYTFKGIHEPLPVWELIDPDAGARPQNNWVDYKLPGFNLHLNFQDIRNYDKRTILNYLSSALDLMEKRQDS